MASIGPKEMAARIAREVAHAERARDVTPRPGSGQRLIEAVREVSEIAKDRESVKPQGRTMYVPVRLPVGLFDAVMGLVGVEGKNRSEVIRLALEAFVKMKEGGT